MHENWVIDAQLSEPPLFCFCPVELDEHGMVKDVMIGLSMFAAKPPSGKVIGVYHIDGQEAVDKWLKDYKEDWKSLKYDLEGVKAE